MSAFEVELPPEIVAYSEHNKSVRRRILDVGIGAVMAFIVVSLLALVFRHPHQQHPLAIRARSVFLDEVGARSYMDKCMSGTDRYRNGSALLAEVLHLERPEAPEVSIVVPTYFSRRYLLRFLYSNYRRQTHCEPQGGQSKCELIVFDNAVPENGEACMSAALRGEFRVGEGDCAFKSYMGESSGEPSLLLQNIAKVDRTVKYIHTNRFGCKGVWPVDGGSAGEQAQMERAGLQPCIDIGEKRNQLAKLARGKILVHFDDDDFYGPGYVGRRVSILHEHLADRRLTLDEPFITKDLRWLEWDMRPIPPNDGKLPSVDSKMCVLDIQRPDSCEFPDPGLDREYGRSCGPQHKHDWGFSWVYTRATIISPKDQSEVCPFFSSSIAEEEVVVHCVMSLDQGLSRDTPDNESIVSLVTPNADLMKIDAGEGSTSQWTPCFDPSNRRVIRESFRYLEEVDTKLIRQHGAACYVLQNHVFAKYAAQIVK